MNKVTSFTHFITGEGDRIAYTYSEISENGEIVNQNIKQSFIVTDAETKNAITQIIGKIEERLEP